MTYWTMWALVRKWRFPTVKALPVEVPFLLTTFHTARVAGSCRFVPVRRLFVPRKVRPFGAPGGPRRQHPPVFNPLASQGPGPAQPGDRWNLPTDRACGQCARAPQYAPMRPRPDGAFSDRLQAGTICRASLGEIRLAAQRIQGRPAAQLAFRRTEPGAMQPHAKDHRPANPRHIRTVETYREHR